MRTTHPIRLLLASVVLATAIVAQTPARANFEAQAEYAILVDAATGAVLYQKNADELMPPASMSKLMTLAVIFKALKEGEVALDDEYPVSENAWRNGGAPSGTSAMFLSLNSRVKLFDLLLGIIVQSGNDACIVVAEGLAGTEEAFAVLMTQYARKIGMKRSTFANSTGLPHPRQRMTARELVQLALHVREEFPEYYRYFAQKKYQYKRYKFYNRNPLVYSKIGVDGLKTGFTKESGYGLVGSGESQGRRLVFVINGAKTKALRKTEARRLYEWGIRGFREFKLYDASQEVGDALVWGGDRMYLPLVGNNGVRVLLPRTVSDKKRLKASIVYSKPLKAPIRKGEQVAVLRVNGGGSSVSEVPLYAGDDVHSAGFLRRGVHALLHLAFGWIL